MLGRLFLGRYETMRLLGEGGMGKVYLARHRGPDEPVVVKVMHEHLAKNSKFLERFRREMDLMASLEHPHAVKLLDGSADDPNGPCIIMEFVPGVTLDKLLAKNGRFSPPRLRRLLAQLCDVLQAAHSKGLVHRDLKPANLMVTDPDSPFEKIKVMDFGLAQMAEPSASMPSRGGRGECAVGTPGYMPPEQVRGQPMDHRGDLYSVGVIMYQLLSGRLPFTGKTTMEILMAQATEGPPTFASIGLEDRVPELVEEVVRACLAPEPGERPQSARELGEAYEAALIQSYTRPADEPEPEPEAAKARRTPQLAAPAATPDPEPEEEPVPNALVEYLQAWMPQQIAAYKVRGFADEVEGQMVESRPELVKIRFKGEGGSGLTWLGLGRKSPSIELELHLRKRDPKQPNLLSIKVIMRPVGGGKLPEQPEWHKRCRKLHAALKAYLMSNG